MMSCHPGVCSHPGVSYDIQADCEGVYLSNEGIQAGLPLQVFLLHDAHALSGLIQRAQIPTSHAASLRT